MQQCTQDVPVELGNDVELDALWADCGAFPDLGAPAESLTIMGGDHRQGPRVPFGLAATHAPQPMQIAASKE